MGQHHPPHFHSNPNCSEWPKIPKMDFKHNFEKCEKNFCQGWKSWLSFKVDSTKWLKSVLWCDANSSCQAKTKAQAQAESQRSVWAWD